MDIHSLCLCAFPSASGSALISTSVCLLCIPHHSPEASVSWQTVTWALSGILLGLDDPRRGGRGQPPLRPWFRPSPQSALMRLSRGTESKDLLWLVERLHLLLSSYLCDLPFCHRRKLNWPTRFPFYNTSWFPLSSSGFTERWKVDCQILCFGVFLGNEGDSWINTGGSHFTQWLLLLELVQLNFMQIGFYFLVAFLFFKIRDFRWSLNGLYFLMFEL